MICQLCKKAQATDKHHLFSQTKANKKMYGQLIHHELNIMYLCNGCHLNKTVPKMTEKEFCDIMGIEIRSKSGRLKWISSK